ncbi:MAG TPA: 50S ribosomal protein L5 [Candidatus Onthocola stercorigallinarum]|nr:50S ribosomal protein L5 [Candidatus Onthocola stercorigallinarum]
MSNFKEKYTKEIIPALMKEFGYTSVMQVPKLEKIIVNIGAGEGSKDEKFITAAVNDLTQITGQKPVVTKARKSIAGFKIREGQPVGVKVTLRGENMYYFFEKLVKVGLPRVRDFRGVSAHSFDGHGNYTLGIKEQLIFPEIEYDDVVKVRGMDIVFVTTAKSNEEAKSLLKGFGMPFKN